MKLNAEPSVESFDGAALFQLRLALKSTYAERLQDLQDMLEFNADAEARNPGLRRAVERLQAYQALDAMSGNL